MYLLDENFFLPLLGCEFENVSLESFSPASLFAKFGQPTLMKNIYKDIEDVGDEDTLSTICQGSSRFQYFISDSLSYVGKFMIFDLENLGETIQYYKDNSKSDLYRSKVFFDGTDLVFIDVKLKEAFAVDHDYNFMKFQ